MAATSWEINAGGTPPLGQLGPVPLGGHPVRRPTFTLRGLESLPVVFAATEKQR